MNILITGFNRPEAFKVVLKQVAEQKYDNLFLSVDSARQYDTLNREKNEQLRQFAIDYAKRNDNVNLIFYDENQGCRKAVSQSISRCFKTVSKLIILEEDCVPLSGFFEYCEWALRKYENYEKIGSISSQSFLQQKYKPPNDVYFSKYHHCWGWATWKRAWDCYEDNVSSFANLINSNKLNMLSSGDFGFEKYWRRIFQGLCNGEYDSWAYRWLFSCWNMGMLSVTPRYSLVKNIGFDNDATHTKSAPFGLERNYCTDWVPQHFSSPKYITRDFEAERVVSNFHYYCWAQYFPLIKRTASLFRILRMTGAKYFGK